MIFSCRWRRFLIAIWPLRLRSAALCAISLDNRGEPESWHDPRDLAEIRVFHGDRFLARALCPELAGRTLALKDLAAARNARRRDLARGIRERDSLVDRLVDVHRPDYHAQLPTPDEPPAVAEPARRLKRYREE